MVCRAAGVDESKVPKQYREAHEETLYADLRAAIEFYSHLTMLVRGQEYDQHFEPLMQAVVTQMGDVYNKAVTITGHKQARVGD
jgi:hypothetical protein